MTDQVELAAALDELRSHLQDARSIVDRAEAAIDKLAAPKPATVWPDTPPVAHWGVPPQSLDRPPVLDDVIAEHADGIVSIDFTEVEPGVYTATVTSGAGTVKELPERELGLSIDREFVLGRDRVGDDGLIRLTLPRLSGKAWTLVRYDDELAAMDELPQVVFMRYGASSSARVWLKGLHIRGRVEGKGSSSRLFLDGCTLTENEWRWGDGWSYGNWGREYVIGCSFNGYRGGPYRTGVARNNTVVWHSEDAAKGVRVIDGLTILTDGVKPINGTHPDAVQLQDGGDDVIIRGVTWANAGESQGIGIPAGSRLVIADCHITKVKGGHGWGLQLGSSKTESLHDVYIRDSSLINGQNGVRPDSTYSGFVIENVEGINKALPEGAVLR